MPSVDTILHYRGWEYGFRVFYSVEPLIPASFTGPEEGGVEIESVFCVAAVQDGRLPLPQETLDALRDELVDLFWREIPRSEVRELCAMDHAARIEAAKEFWGETRMEADHVAAR